MPRCVRRQVWPGCSAVGQSILKVIEALVAAGYRPTVYRHIAPPQFLKRMIGRMQMLDELDPFECHGPDLDPR